ncbi:hypothetical protein [Jiangella rhizosphaerae]|uniref:Uncharacterized protein n=1 Tax=Jiangella rhizosphaerae TaxID=2293569 RepID=A0A418KN24_9ACTN|nr:hypothetical protein [Jiangella rhizosphaerae]RIQ20419.1 hypothetical protein DY240_18015 [Jiangella rhizosphaerae]
MTGPHVLNDVRRWLVQPGTEVRLLAALLMSVLVIAGGLVLLQHASDAGTSGGPASAGAGAQD